MLPVSRLLHAYAIQKCSCQNHRIMMAYTTKNTHQPIWTRMCCHMARDSCLTTTWLHDTQTIPTMCKLTKRRLDDTYTRKQMTKATTLRIPGPLHAQQARNRSATRHACTPTIFLLLLLPFPAGRHPLLQHKLSCHTSCLIRCRCGSLCCCSCLVCSRKLGIILPLPAMQVKPCAIAAGSRL